MAQLAAIAARFPEIRKALLFGNSDAPVKISSMERVYPECEQISHFPIISSSVLSSLSRSDPETILRFPCLRGFYLTDHVRRRIAAYFHTNMPVQTFHAWLGFIPERCERWGKLRIADGGDCIRGAAVVDPLSPYGRRDASFVRVSTQNLDWDTTNFTTVHIL